MNTQPNTAIETTLNLCDTDITIRQASAGKEVYVWDAMRYRHTVTIKANDVSKRFSYHGSINDYNDNKDRLTEDDLKDVLECVISDGIAGLYECEEFFSEFGYETPCEGLKAFKACKKTLSRLEDMGIDENILYDISNAISELNEVD